jgi:hypothetical protein
VAPRGVVAVDQRRRQDGYTELEAPCGQQLGTTWRIGGTAVARAAVAVFSAQRWHAELTGEARFMELDHAGEQFPEDGTELIAGIGVRRW